MKKSILYTLFILAANSLFLLANGTGKELYQSCAGCHGEKGEEVALQKSKLIGGQDSNLTIKELIAYKNGELNQYGLGNIMKLQLSTISEEEIKELANYIESLDKNVSD